MFENVSRDICFAKKLFICNTFFKLILISVLDFMLVHQVKIKWKWEMIDWNNWNIISFCY